MTDTNLAAVAPDAAFIFKGTVQQVGVTTMPSAPASDRTLVVRVDQVVHAPDAVKDLAGENVTLRLADGAPTVNPGQQEVFFANAWLYGDSLALQELDRRPVPDEALLAGVSEARHNAGLRSHVNDADAVIVGRVESLSSAEDRRVGRISEHDPRWWEATVEVESVEKGNLPAGEQIRVLFPNSEDVRWHRAPKLAPGHESIFILHEGETEPSLSGGGLVVLHAEDVQPRDALPQVRSLLGPG
jgi:hypothetical protein